VGVLLIVSYWVVVMVAGCVEGMLVGEGKGLDAVSSLLLCGRRAVGKKHDPVICGSSIVCRIGKVGSG